VEKDQVKGIKKNIGLKINHIIMKLLIKIVKEETSINK